MFKDYKRQDRVGELIKHEIYHIIQEDINDPRVGMLSITKVLVSKDFKHVKVFVSCIKEEETEDTLKGLSSARGYIQKKLGDKIKLRNTPRLVFKEDVSIKYGLHINDVLEELKKSS